MGLFTITRKQLAKISKKTRDEDINKSYIKESLSIDEDFAKIQIISSKIENDLFMAVIQSNAKQTFATVGQTEGISLKITAMIQGNFTKINNITKEKIFYKENYVLIEYLKQENTTIIQEKGNNLKYIHITIKEQYLKENPYILNILNKGDKNDFLINFFYPNIKNQYLDLFSYPYDNKIDKLYLKNKTMDLMFFALTNAKSNFISLNYLNEDDIIRIKKAKNILDNDFHKNITIAYLSKAVAVNEFKLKKGFKDLYKNTIRNYLIQTRLNKACEYLKSNKYSINEISTMVGYKTQASFSYAFSKKYNSSPKNFFNKKN